MDENTNKHPYWLPDKVYDVLKWLALLAIPALALFVNTVGPVWGMPHVDEVVTTLNALGTLVGVLIGASKLKSRSAATD